MTHYNSGPHRSKEDVLKAIKGSKGIIRAIAASLKVSRITVHRYFDRWPECKEAYEEECEGLLDMAEAKLYQLAIVEGKESSLHFLLATKGKERGYVRARDEESEKKPNEGKKRLDLTRLPKETLGQLIEALEPANDQPV